MRTLVVVCDKCRRPAESDRVVLSVEAGSPLPGWRTEVSTGKATVDLCGECAEDLNSWLGGRSIVNPDGQNASIGVDYGSSTSGGDQLWKRERSTGG